MTLRKSLLCALALLAFAPLTRGADLDSERDRKARVALALAGANKPTVTLAPAPRPAPRDYPTAYKVATSEGKPLVVFVGCRASHSAPGAVTARVDSLPDVDGPAAVVLYPVGARLYQHGEPLRCPLEDEELAAAVKAAAKKIENPPAKATPAPAPLDWEISAPRAPEKCPDCVACPKCSKHDPRDSLVRVRKGDAMGTGAVVHSGQGWSIVLTAFHVVNEPGDLTVRGYAGKTHPAQILASDKLADLAALLIPVDMPALKLTDAEPGAGAELEMHGLTSLYTRGKVGTVRWVDGHDQYLYATPEDSDSGDSGAPVMFDGKLCGVHLGRIEKGGQPRAASIRPVRAILKKVLSGEVKAAPVTPSSLSAKPAVATGQQPGDIVTVSGRVLRPTGRGTYIDVGEQPTHLPAYPFGAPSCPGGRCPLPR